MSCRHVPTVRVASHVDLQAAMAAGEAIASEYSCERAACLAAAKRRVAADSLRTPVVVPLPTRQARAAHV